MYSNTSDFSVSWHIHDLLEKNSKYDFFFLFLFFPSSSFQKWSLNPYTEYGVITYILCGQYPDISSNQRPYLQGLAYVTTSCFSSK